MIGAPQWYDFPLSGYGRGVVCRKLGLGPDTDDRLLAVAVRGFQRVAGLPTHGEIDVPTARALGEEANLNPPDWWEDSMGRPDLLRRFDIDDAALRRIEGNRGIRPGEGQPVELARILTRLGP